MDNSGLRTGFLSGPNGGFLDLETSVHRHQQTQFNHPSLPHEHDKNVMSGVNDYHQPVGVMEIKGSTPKGFATSFGKGRALHPNNALDSENLSEDDEPSCTDDGNGENSSGGKGKKGSPWQRMKWTDNIIRLLIAVVACVGDDSNVEYAEGLKRKSGILQKKGKWKTVSKIMIGKGCHVSPQQCEDKFNDLNKRYKKLNDILGRGASCQVVENPSLMDSMPQLSAKAKDDVRKILSSKHLFFKEMCAYHSGEMIPNCHDYDLQGHSFVPKRSSNGNNGSEEEEAEGKDDSEDDESDNEDDDDNDEGDGEGSSGEHRRRNVNEEDGSFWSQPSSRLDTFEVEMAEIFQDPNKSSSEQRQWIKKKMLHLQEQRFGLQARAFELEEQRFKWLRYCTKKDRELERLKLENERTRLENENAALQLKQKELEINFRMPEASLDSTASLSLDRLKGRDQIDLSQH